MAIYKVESVQTTFVIISTGDEKDGQDVLSKPSIPCMPADSVCILRWLSLAVSYNIISKDLTFSAPVSGAVTFVNVKGKAGLYISADTAVSFGFLFF
jgi:hypothetical protein